MVLLKTGLKQYYLADEQIVINSSLFNFRNAKPLTSAIPETLAVICTNSYLNMTEESLKTLVADIDSLIREQPWFDFHIISYADSKLTIAGGTDLTYYHTVEIVFHGVFFFSGFPQGWRSTTNSSVLMIPDNTHELNLKYEIESGYQLFLFKTDDYQQIVIIAAESLTYNRDTVYYYDRPNLGNGERVAEFVKTKQTN